MNITLAEYRKHAYSSRPRAGESVQDDLFANYASWLAGVPVKIMRATIQVAGYRYLQRNLIARGVITSRKISRSSARRSIKRKAGGRYAADLVLQLPARGSGSVALHCDYQNYSDQ
jgi:hypothetical protein